MITIRWGREIHYAPCMSCGGLGVKPSSATMTSEICATCGGYGYYHAVITPHVGAASPVDERPDA